MTSRAWWFLTAVVLFGPRATAAPPERYRRERAKTPLELLRQDAKPAPTSAPVSRPSGRRPAPFGRGKHRPPYALAGVVEYSNGRMLPGHIWTPSGKAWRIYELASKQFRDIPLDVVKRIDAVVEWERMEDDWRWKEGGMDVKIYTGKQYPNRMTTYRFTLLDDREIIGNIAQMFFLELGGEVARATLHKRQQGKIGQSLDDLPYVRTVVFDAKAMRDAIEKLTATQPTTHPWSTGNRESREPGR